MLTNKKVIITALFVVIMGAYYIYSMQSDTTPIEGLWEKGGLVDTELVEQGGNKVLNESNSKKFEHSNLGITFLYPQNLNQSEIRGDNGETVFVFQDTVRAQGFQIMVTPFDENISVLDEARIRADVPDLKIENPEDVILGASGKGLAFMSDNEAFAKNSREVWFVFRNNLYQISTYAKQDPLLQSVLATWQFK